MLYLTSGRVEDITSGRAKVVGRDNSGAVIAKYVTAKTRMPLSTWLRPSHNAETGGTNLLKSLLGEKGFPYPKSLYAVEDALRYFVKDKPEALIVDFFAGSGTTAHAVARLNRQDGGRRHSIIVTNNEVSAIEASGLRKSGHRQGDRVWEALGICESVTKPRIKAAFTGLRADGTPIEDDYKYTDIFPMSAGFEENVEFFELTYEDPDRVSLDMAFSSVAPLLWLKAGALGRRIDKRADGYDIADTYGVLFDIDSAEPFVRGIVKTCGSTVSRDLLITS